MFGMSTCFVEHFLITQDHSSNFVSENFTCNLSTQVKTKEGRKEEKKEL